MADFQMGDMPLDMQAELSDILTRRKLAESRAQRFAGGYLGYQGNQQLDATNKQMQEVLGKYSTGLQGAVSDYVAKRNGAAAIPAPADDLGGGPGKPAVAADPQGAIIQALTSQYGPVQRLAGLEMKHNEPYTLAEGAQRVTPPVFG